MRTGDLCQLAADLALEHGEGIAEFAKHATAALESEGDRARAQFWKMLSVLLDDILARRTDPACPVTIH